MKFAIAIILSLATVSWGLPPLLPNAPCGFAGLSVVANCQDQCGNGMNFVGGNSCGSTQQCCWIPALPAISVPTPCTFFSPLAACTDDCSGGATLISATCDSGACCWFGGLGR